MRWRKAKKILRKKPYLLDPVRVRSMEAAKEALYEEGLPSAQELVYAACRKAGIAEEDYESFLGMTKSRFERRCRRYEPVRLGKLFRVTKKVIVIAALVVLLCLFMAATPTGRAIAVSIYDAVSELVGDILHIRPIDAQEGALETVAIDGSATTMTFDTIEEAETYWGQHIYHFNADQMQVKLNTITVIQNMPLGDVIISTYTGDSQLTIVLAQTNHSFNQTVEERLMLGKGEYCLLQLDNGLVFEGCYTKDDRTYVGACIVNNTTIEISISRLPSSCTLQFLLCELH